jgi:FkbH-like protein
MLIGWEDFAAVRVNWQPKSKNIREMATELNIGSDAMVLFDDNPVERAEVCANAPEVGIIAVPADPLYYPQALLDSGYFDQVTLSAEDRGRVEMYRQEHQRRTVAQTFDSADDFLESLEMEAEVGRAGATTLARIGQLVEKTNQFNLTTRRHRVPILLMWWRGCDCATVSAIKGSSAWAFSRRPQTPP